MAGINSKVTASAVVCLLLACLWKANGYTMQNMCAQWAGEGYIGNPSDCTAWGYCRANKLIGEGACAKGQVYESSSGTCQMATKCPCSTSVAQTCSVIQNPSYMADPSDCNKYAYCFGNGKSEINKCPAGQNYAANNNSCVWGPSCPQSSICRFMPNNIYVGDPNNCGSYLQCLNGYGIAGKCSDPPYLNFNPATGSCQVTSVCNGNTNPNDGDSNMVTLPDNAKACDGVAAGTEFVSDKTTCYGFFSCATKTLGVWGACPYGTTYDPTKNKCVSPAAYPCWFNRCQNTNMTYATLKNTNCKQYVYCPNGSVGTCPDGFAYFDEVYQKCVPSNPDYAICGTSVNPNA